MEEDAKVDVKIRHRLYKHPRAKEFKKTIFIGYFDEHLLVPKWAISNYVNRVDPCQI